MALSTPVNLSDNRITEAVVERQKAIFAKENYLRDTPNGDISSDKDWVGDYTSDRDSVIIRGSLIRGVVDTKTFDAVDIRHRSYSSAKNKFQDASLGGNYPINPTPQFTRYADIREKGLIPGRTEVALSEEGSGGNSMFTESVGLGRYYNEAIEETSQIIHMRFGVPEFNSMTQFFTSFYNEDAARVARTGRGKDAFFTIGQVAGLVVNVLYWPLLAAHAIGAGLRFLFKKPASKFYYMKPTMPIYWNTVTTMVNQWAVFRGLYPAALQAAGTQKLESPMKVDNEVMSALANAMPDIFDAKGGVDVSKAASRAGRMARQLDLIMNEAMNGAEDWEGFVGTFGGTKITDVKPGIGIADKLSAWFSTEGGEEKKADNIERSLRVQQGDAEPKYPTSFGEFLVNEFNDASDWATFKVRYTGSVGESFSNTAVESDLAAKLNSTSAKNKSAYFSFAGGNISDAIGGVTDAVSSFAKGVLDSFGASGLVSLAGSAFVDIPRHWESSSTQMPRSTYTMQLISPYGNTISQLMNIYIPFFMILAAALPKSTGRQSHTWPFLVEMYDPGRAQTRLGMIDSLSVNRGITNLGFNKDHNAMGIEVTFSVIDMSSVMSMPVNAGFSFKLSEGLFDDDNLYTDYMNILASVDLNNQIYLYNKMKLRTITRLRNYKSMFTTQTLAREIRNLPGISALDVFFKGTNR